jgi:ADP-ribosylglycohydrolase
LTPLQRSLESLQGLSIGDALGQCYFSLSREDEERSLVTKVVPPAPWFYTDDTEMSMSVVAALAGQGGISQDRLASDFAARYSYDRAYGPAMHRALERIRSGEDWRSVSKSLFGGEGSFGNGAAMRSAPVGAYFMEDTAAVIREATLAAEVTHSHPEGIAGSIAVAIAASIACRCRNSRQRPSHAEFLDQVASFVPASQVRARIEKARAMENVEQIHFPVSVLGGGQLMAAHDTVPFALWCCAQSLEDFAGAIWLGIKGGIDRDTICAIVVCYVGAAGIPEAWITQREPLPEWFASVHNSIADASSD